MVNPSDDVLELSCGTFYCFEAEMKRLLIWPIRGYQLLLSPVLPSSCRFYPSCSQYAITAIERHGAVKGLYLALSRILRCHPFHPGGIDPVP